MWADYGQMAILAMLMALCAFLMVFTRQAWTFLAFGICAIFLSTMNEQLVQVVLAILGGFGLIGFVGILWSENKGG